MMSAVRVAQVLALFRSPPRAALVGALLAAAHTAAQPGTGGQADLPSTALRLPFSIETAMVIRNAAELRGMEVGDATWHALLDAGIVGDDTIGAWDTLAASLKLGPGAAFDRLLGRSCTIVARGLAGDGPPDWVIVCEIADDTRARLLQSLRPAARGIGDAATVLTIEGGQIDMALGASVDRGEGVPTAPLILAPASSRPLFDEVRASLVSGGIPGEPLAGGAGPHATLLWGEQGTGSWAEIRGVPTTTGWSLVTKSFPSRGVATGAWSHAAVRLWTELDDDPAALAWMAGSSGPSPPMPSSLRRIADDLAAALLVPHDLVGPLCDASALRVARQGSSVSASLLLRGGSDPRFASTFDAWVRRLLDAGSPEPISPDEQAQGLATLEDHAGSTLERLFGRRHALRWMLVPSREPGRPPWALIDVRPYRADAGDADGRHLRQRVIQIDAEQVADPGVRRLAAAGSARPWDLAQAMGMRDSPLAGLRWIDRVAVVVPAPGAPAGAPTSIEAQWVVDLDLRALAPAAAPK
ncbi:MAG: hypothetical protein FJ255_04175 [Phycisphaerae bacterium]|nr:hypothetical protein [Phycisphaerae bacterium]